MKIFTFNRKRLYGSAIRGERNNNINEFFIHRHEYFEVEYIIKGNGTYPIDDVEYPLEDGMLYFTTPASVHSMHSDDLTDLINVSFTYELCSEINIPELVESGAPVAIKLKGEDKKLIEAMLKEIVAVQDTDNIIYQANLISCVLRKIIILSEAKKSTHTAYIRKALIYILGNFSSGITLNSVAEYLGVTPVYLCKYFKENMGISFQKYIDDIRFNHAERLLKTTEMNISQICTNSGFKDYSNFMHRFKNKYGMTPKDYRKAKK